MELFAVHREAVSAVGEMQSNPEPADAHRPSDGVEDVPHDLVVAPPVGDVVWL